MSVFLSLVPYLLGAALYWINFRRSASSPDTPISDWAWDMLSPLLVMALVPLPVAASRPETAGVLLMVSSAIVVFVAVAWGATTRLRSVGQLRQVPGGRKFDLGPVTWARLLFTLGEATIIASAVASVWGASQTP